MQGDFVREQEIKINNEKELNKMILQNISKTKKELTRIQNNYEFAEAELIDYYLYQMKAVQAKLDYLIKIAKTKGLQMDMIKDIEFTFWDNNEEVG